MMAAQRATTLNRLQANTFAFLKKSQIQRQTNTVMVGTELTNPNKTVLNKEPRYGEGGTLRLTTTEGLPG